MTSTDSRASARIRGTSIIRFDTHQRAQHTLMFVSFIALAITGLPLRWSEWPSSVWWMDRWGGIEVTRAVHRYAAWVMIAACVYHLLYVLMKRPFSTAMLPRLKDVGDFITDMKHTFRLGGEAPQFDRFSYRNKFAYWLVWVGAIIIIATGLVLTYPLGAAERLGSWAYPLALILHSDAAVLAVGWMTLVHVYFAHFSRHVFPADKSIFTGKVPAWRYREEFPLEYARIVAAAGYPVLEGVEETPPAQEEQPAPVRTTAEEEQ